MWWLQTTREHKGEMWIVDLHGARRLRSSSTQARAPPPPRLWPADHQQTWLDRWRPVIFQTGFQTTVASALGVQVVKWVIPQTQLHHTPQSIWPFSWDLHEATSVVCTSAQRVAWITQARELKGKQTEVMAARSRYKLLRTLNRTHSLDVWGSLDVSRENMQNEKDVMNKLEEWN